MYVQVYCVTVLKVSMYKLMYVDLNQAPMQPTVGLYDIHSASIILFMKYITEDVKDTVSKTLCHF